MVKKTNKVSQLQPAPLVSISITRSSSRKQSRVSRIERQNLVAVKQPKSKERATKNISACCDLNGKRKKRGSDGSNNAMDCWVNGQNTDAYMTGDLEESEQSSIPLHHSPSVNFREQFFFKFSI